MDYPRQIAHHASWQAWKTDEMSVELHKKAAVLHLQAAEYYPEDDLKRQIHLRARSSHLSYLDKSNPYKDIGNIENAKKIKGWMWEPELRWLAAHAMDCSEICEIGSALGRSTRALADNMKDGGHLFAIDIWRTPSAYHGGLRYGTGDERYQQFLENTLDIRDRVTAIRVNSAEGPGIVNNRMFDLVFVDGDHSEKCCTSDILQFGPLVRVGGILAGHDFYQPGVFQSVKNLIGEVETWGRIWWTRVI